MSATELDAKPASTGPLQSLTALHWTGVLLATITGGIHLWTGVTRFKPPLLVAAAGFAVGIAAVVGDVRRRRIVELGIPFTAGQILLYFAIHGYLAPWAPEFARIELADKAVQSALAVVLVVLHRRG